MPVYYGGMKKQYNLVTIKFKIVKAESIKGLFTYKELIRSFRILQDLGVIEVKYFDNKAVEKMIMGSNVL